ncbi:portal protein [Microbacterium phage YellowPanda]|uniref:Portal protein n=2 Tax=Tinytimothyvirus tinytimothy TaxID=2845596 RepID=A0A5Q2WM33_9CAUD|nr:portal protein [Microbacterium phage TinyTimothy]QDF16982.1 portal protein [Microbacterium phage TinyTimothy]QGH78671.1 portal protein [Microbacterium phage Wesak]
MSNKAEFEAVTEFEDWYKSGTRVNHLGQLVPSGFAPCAMAKYRKWRDWKSEMDSRVGQYWKYEKQAAAEVVSKKPDLPNISSGESAGFVRRIARNVVQHTPNVFIMNEFDDDSIQGALARHILKTKIIGDDEYSNNMQQNLVTTARRGFTIGFDCVIPVLLQDNSGSWYIQYDNIGYQDVFPEPGAKDIRRAKEVYVRRYMTRGEVQAIIKNQTEGWDISAMRQLLGTAPPRRERPSHEDKKHSYNPDAYEIITWYNSYGDPFLWFDASMKLLLRIERNVHPLKEHPVFFYVPEKDDMQPYGKSLLSLTYGRQEFQDLYMNGAYKMFVRDINPPIIGIGVTNAAPNLSPGKYTEFSNPNAKLEAFTVNSQSLMMFGQISQNNQANMVSMLGAADQQMAAQSTGGMMSQTPQGVEAQQQMVDITTNNYQKAMEQFFSRYCSYALTLYFQELKGTKKIRPSADVRKQLIDEGVPPEAFIHEAHEVVEKGEDGVERVRKVPADDTGLKDGWLKVDFADLATTYFVQCVPGSLVELEDEKQLRILREIFVPLSQAMPAMAQAGDQDAIRYSSAAMKYIVKKTIELSGSAHSSELGMIFDGETEQQQALDARIKLLEDTLGGTRSEIVESSEGSLTVLEQMQQQIQILTQTVGALVQGLTPAPGAGGQTDPSARANQATPAPAPEPTPATV